MCRHIHNVYIELHLLHWQIVFSNSFILPHMAVTNKLNNFFSFFCCSSCCEEMAGKNISKENYYTKKTKNVHLDISIFWPYHGKLFSFITHTLGLRFHSFSLTVKWLGLAVNLWTLFSNEAKFLEIGSNKNMWQK